MSPSWWLQPVQLASDKRPQRFIPYTGLLSFEDRLYWGIANEDCSWKTWYGEWYTGSDVHELQLVLFRRNFALLFLNQIYKKTERWQCFK